MTNKLMMMSTLAGLGVAVLLGGGMAPSSLASNDDLNKAVPGQQSAGPGLSMEAIIAKLKAQGYVKIHKIEREHGYYEIKTSNASGTRHELYVDPQTGKILKNELDD